MRRRELESEKVRGRDKEREKVRKRQLEIEKVRGVEVVRMRDEGR